MIVKELRELVCHVRVASLAGLDTDSMCTEIEEEMDEIERLATGGESTPVKSLHEVGGDEDFKATLEGGLEVDGEDESYNHYFEDFECKEDEESLTVDEEVIVNYLSSTNVMVRYPSM